MTISGLYFCSLNAKTRNQKFDVLFCFGEKLTVNDNQFIVPFGTIVTW